MTRFPLILSGLNTADIENLKYLVEIYSYQENYTEAEILCQRALTICEKTLGPDHPDMAFILDDYDKLLRKTKRKREAVKFERRAKILRARLQSLRKHSLTV